MKKSNLPRVGFDIGGSRIKSILVIDGKVISFFVKETPKTEKHFTAMLQAMFRAFSGNQNNIKNIGIGVAGVLEGTRVVLSPNIAYLKGIDFKNIFPNHNLKVANDAKALLIGECAVNKALHDKKVLLFTIGTGIGRAFAVNGAVQNITSFEYPEVWEKDYQELRRKKDDVRLAKFLAEKLIPFTVTFQPNIILIGGGISEKIGFMEKMKEEFKKNNASADVQKSTLHNHLTALGAVHL